MLHTMSHPIKLFEVWTERVDGKPVQRTAPLGVLALDGEQNKERRKNKARELARSHVGRDPSNVSHGLDNSVVVTFRRT
jgi:hypothetical protein